jgi:hypothetical protein
MRIAISLSLAANLAAMLIDDRGLRTRQAAVSQTQLVLPPSLWFNLPGRFVRLAAHR